MRTSRTPIPWLFLIGWLAFAGWQRTEYVHQRDLIRATLQAQADVLSDALSSIVQSHYWFGPFVQEQLPATLSELSKSQNTLTLALFREDNGDADPGPADRLKDSGPQSDRETYWAGDENYLDPSVPIGVHWRPECLQVVRRFKMRTSPPWMQAKAGVQLASVNDDFLSIVVLDRSDTELQLSREFRSRLLAFGLGSLLLLSVGVAWNSHVRLARAEGKAKFLQSEARHLKELGQAAAGLAHETRNPLGLIRGWTQRLLESKLPSSEQQHQAETILEECDRVTARINQFLAFARPNEPNLEPVRVIELIEELKFLLEPDLAARGLDWNTAQLDPQTVISADRELVRQALFNLLQNAIAFSPQQGTISVSVQLQRAGLCRLAVGDQGPGPDPEVAERLFEPYVTGRPDGTGLGLPIVRKIAAAHGWNVSFTRPPEGGCIFWINDISTICSTRSN